MIAGQQTSRTEDHVGDGAAQPHLSLVPRPAGTLRGARTPGRRPATRHVVPIRLMVLLIAVAGAFLAFSLRVEAGAPESVDHVIVERGDSLWEVAAIATEPGGDVRETIARIIEMNELPSSTIHPGQRLVVPGS